MDLTQPATAVLSSGDIERATSLREVAGVLHQPGLAKQVERALLHVPARPPPLRAQRVPQRRRRIRRPPPELKL